MRRPARSRGLSCAALAVLGLLTLGGCAGTSGGNARSQAVGPAESSLAPYVVTPTEVVEGILRLAEVGTADVVYDLGSGDGRIVIAAARLHGARGVGFELDPALVRQAEDNARRAGVSHLVEFRVQDVLTVDLSPATVVTVYLSPEANLKLRPRMQAQLRPGARIVSHEFDMGDWAAEAFHEMRDESGRVRFLYLWRIGPRR